MNHVGFQCPERGPESMARWKAAGLKAQPSAANPTGGVVTGPDDLRIEIAEDKSQTVPIAIHHVHFFVIESAIPEIKAWYVKTFGAKPGTRAGF